MNHMSNKEQFLKYERKFQIVNHAFVTVDATFRNTFYIHFFSKKQNYFINLKKTCSYWRKNVFIDLYENYSLAKRTTACVK